MDKDRWTSIGWQAREIVERVRKERAPGPKAGALPSPRGRKDAEKVGAESAITTPSDDLGPRRTKRRAIVRAAAQGA